MSRIVDQDNINLNNFQGPPNLMQIATAVILKLFVVTFFTVCSIQIKVVLPNVTLDASVISILGLKDFQIFKVLLYCKRL